MLTEFVRVPPRFVEFYRQQFETWAREFRTRGRKVAIRFQRPVGVPPLLDGDGRVVHVGAWLEAEVDGSGPQPRMVVRPASDHDAEMIERHVVDLARMVN